MPNIASEQEHKPGVDKSMVIMRIAPAKYIALEECIGAGYIDFAYFMGAVGAECPSNTHHCYVIAGPDFINLSCIYNSGLNFLFYCLGYLVDLGSG